MQISTILDTTPPNLILMLGTEVIESHLRLVYADESTYIDALAAAAVRAVEYEANTEHGSGSLTVYANNIPGEHTFPVDASRISVSDVEYKNTDGDWTPVNPEHYEFTSQGNPMVFHYLEDSLPDDMDTESMESFRIVAAYAAAEMPETMKQAALLMLAHLYQNREAVSNEKVYDLPLAFTYLIGKGRKNPLR